MTRADVYRATLRCFLEPVADLLYDDESVSEVLINGPDHIYCERAGRLERTGRRFADPHLPAAAARNLAEYVGRRLDADHHSMDARLPEPEQFRVHAVIPPASRVGTCLSIRKLRRANTTLPWLVGNGSVSPAAAEYLELMVRAHRNLIVAGGTGTGKTTLLNALSEFVPDKERVVTVEDTAELQLRKGHVVGLQGRQANAEGAGAVGIRGLVRNALRMRPDRIIVGECRGGEAIDMLQAMNTGHDGSMTTLHANTPAGVVRRLEVLVQQNADAALPAAAIHQQIASAVDLIVQLGSVVRSGRRVRLVTETAEVAAADAGGVRLVPLFAREADGPLRATGHLPSFLPDLIATGLVADPAEFVRAAAAPDPAEAA